MLSQARTWAYWFIGVWFMLCLLGTAYSHDMYKDWKQFNGASCCDNSDCAPTEERMRNGNYEAFFDGKWIPVPDSKIRKERSPDGNAHLCAKALEPDGHVMIYCFQPGMGS